MRAASESEQSAAIHHLQAPSQASTGPQPCDRTSHTTIGVLSPLDVEGRHMTRLAPNAPINRPEPSCEMKSRRFTAWSLHGHQHCRPSEAQPKYPSTSASSSTRKDRWRDTCSCLNITFPVLCASPRHSCAPPLAFSEGEFRREQLVCRDAHIWCSVVSQGPSR